MPKHQEKNQHPTSYGTEEVAAFVKKFSLSAEDESYCLEQLAHEGPEHKQAYASLLLTRMGKLVAAIEKTSGQSFVPQKGAILEFGKHEKVASPISLPSSSLKKEEADEMLSVLSKSPEHEGVLFNLLLQAVEWSLKQGGK